MPPAAAMSPALPPPVAPQQTAPELDTPVEEPSQTVNETEPAKVKDEVMTPRPSTETGDTTADESVAGRRQGPRLAKRKREESSPTPLPAAADNHAPLIQPGRQTESVEPERPSNQVMWTRAFNKVSGSAMEQIVRHRSANMFATPIREKDAPGYRKVILQPQDLKSIKAAIMSGNRAASQAAAALPGGDPNTSSVWIPVNESLLPPKGIINSSQLDCELAHMFANAIMYNPDAGHGPGPAFLRTEDETEGEGVDTGAPDNGLGYKVDEFGVVNDARAMYMEVDKLLSELRSAEVRREAGKGGMGAMTGTSTRQASVTHRDSMSRDDSMGHGHDDGDDQTATEAETVGNTVKRRRITRGDKQG